MAPKQRKSGKDKVDVGDQVIHPTFGVGTVLHKVGDGDEAKLTVAFPDEGQKKLLAKYAKLKRMRAGKTVEEEESTGKTLLEAAAEKEDKEVEIEEIGDEDEVEEIEDEDWEEDEVEEMYDDDEDDDDK